MSAELATSTGHALSDTRWLDTHFQSAQVEYEEALKYVGIQPGWQVLDAGCGGGAFLPMISDRVGSEGTVSAVDLAPENIASVIGAVGSGHIPAKVDARVGSLTALPFDDASFDCVWSANVLQYLTEADFDQAMSEFIRVLKPGGTLALKDFDDSIFQARPIDPNLMARNLCERRRKAQEASVLGTACGASLPTRLRQAGLLDIRRRSWFVERWAPVQPATRTLAGTVIKRWATQAETYDLSASDVESWRQIAKNVERILNDPDFCWREAFVVAVGNVRSTRGTE